MAQGAQGGASRDSQHQDAFRITRGMEKRGGGEEIPGEAGEKAFLVMPCMDGSGDADFGGKIGFPQLEFLEPGFKFFDPFQRHMMTMGRKGAMRESWELRSAPGMDIKGDERMVLCKRRRAARSG